MNYAAREKLRTAIEQARAEAREEAVRAANRMMRAAIRLEEQAQPEPVAWMARTQDWSEPNDTSWQYGPWVDGLDARFIPLYAHPPRAEPAPEAVATHRAPAIGQPWPGQGGIYAGITRGEGGQPDSHLVLCPTVPDKRLAWKPASEWATTIEHDGHADYRVPTRTESALLYANLRDQLDPALHWTSTQYSEVNAFGQYFGYGCQSYYGKKHEGRVRAVRRFTT